MNKEKLKIQICVEIETLFGGFLNMDGYDRSRVETVADNIISKLSNSIIIKSIQSIELIAEGVCNVDADYGEWFYVTNSKNETIHTMSEFEKYNGKSIRIYVQEGD